MAPAHGGTFTADANVSRTPLFSQNTGHRIDCGHGACVDCASRSRDVGRGKEEKSLPPARHFGADAALAALPGHALPIWSISDFAVPVASAASMPDVCHEPSAAFTKVRFARDGE